jgi:hypothetical protein
MALVLATSGQAQIKAPLEDACSITDHIPGVASGQAGSCSSACGEFSSASPSSVSEHLSRIGTRSIIRKPIPSYSDPIDINQSSDDQQAEGRATKNGEWPVRIPVTNSRVDIRAPKDGVILGRQTRINLVLHAPGLSTLSIVQMQYYNNDREQPDEVEGSDETVSILRDRDQSPYIVLTPMRLGDVEVRISGRFPDGGPVLKSLVIHVLPPADPPDRLMTIQTGLPGQNAETITMYMHPEGLRDALIVYAIYGHLNAPIKLDPSAISYRMKTGDETSPVSLNERTGGAHSATCRSSVDRNLFRRQGQPYLRVGQRSVCGCCYPSGCVP